MGTIEVSQGDLPRFFAFLETKFGKGIFDAFRKEIGTPVVHENSPASPASSNREDTGESSAPSSPGDVSPASPGASSSNSDGSSRPPSPADMECDTPSADSDAASATDQSSSDEDFIVVGAKRAKRAKKNKNTPPAKTQRSTEGAAVPSTAGIKTRDHAGSRKPPPIVIQDKSSWNKVSAALKEKRISFTHARVTSVGIKVTVPTPADHRQLTAFLRANSVGYHTYALEEEKRLRVVIRGVPREIDCQEVLTDLRAQHYPVHEVHRMYRARTKAPLDMVLVVLDLSPEGKAIFNIKTVCLISGLSVEPPNKRTYPGQCHRCQFYGHSARNCFARERCVKCLGDHGTKQCDRVANTQTPPSCVLCGQQGHTANYRGCPRAPRPGHNKAAPSKVAKAPAPRAARPAPPPAPQPTTAPPPPKNAWVRPPVVKATPPPPAPTAAPTPAKAAAPPSPPSPTPQLSAVSGTGFAADFALVAKLACAIDAGEISALASKLRLAKTPQDKLAAVCEHISVLVAVSNFTI
ncbi:uncharacterized protein LOC116413489 [Galleria mellonella]|uniref:Uncharacterized protein LOC116413489 n=1 Tax=Galleria mellonella TaxID=7137 RepID=A0ABM3MT99_GALME|nr:uncharacterized protein LOC116413489 [Galleria mellonella]